MSTRDLGAWRCLVTTVLVWGGYVLWVAGAPQEAAVMSVVLAAAIGAHALLTGGARARRERDALADERDAAIGLRASSNAHRVLLVAVALRVFTPAPRIDSLGACGRRRLPSLVAAELLRFAPQLLAYRRGG